MRLVIAALLALSSSLARADDPEQFVGSWRYWEHDAFLSINLKPKGQCLIVVSLTNDISGHIVECTYVVEGSDITIHWKHQINGQVPPPSRLVFVANRNLIRVEGEPERVLRRTRATWESR
jgi:hypothetical protein